MQLLVAKCTKRTSTPSLLNVIVWARIWLTWPSNRDIIMISAANEGLQWLSKKLKRRVWCWINLLIKSTLCFLLCSLSIYQNIALLQRRRSGAWFTHPRYMSTRRLQPLVYQPQLQIWIDRPCLQSMQGWLCDTRITLTSISIARLLHYWVKDCIQNPKWALHCHFNGVR